MNPASQNHRILKNSRGQIGETMTWIVATVIIIVILLLSIFAASFMGNNRKANFSKSVGDPELIGKKSMVSYLLTDGSSGQKIYFELQGDNKMNDMSNGLAKEIFLSFKNNYVQVWLGFIKGEFLGKGVIHNIDGFGSRPFTKDVSSTGQTFSAPYFDEEIIIDKSINKKLNLILVDRK